MFKRYLMVLSMLLALPAFANAWYVNAKTSPTSGSGTISPAGNTTYAAGANSGVYTITPAAGKKISRVTIDGVNVGYNLHRYRSLRCRQNLSLPRGLLRRRRYGSVLHHADNNRWKRRHQGGYVRIPDQNPGRFRPPAPHHPEPRLYGRQRLTAVRRRHHR